MRLAKMILAGSALTIVSAMAHAQTTPAIKETPPPPGTHKGLVTVVDRLNGTIAIRAEQSNPEGTKAPDGAKAEGEKAEGAKEGAKPEAKAEEGITEQFKIDPKLSETVHAGDKVKFSSGDSGDPKTITKIEAE
ncbi:hypothetical protein [Nitrobacter sp. JJSN]|jgi:hypothetical protein|uniref:hypothetical protein n=1 Tax=Nitrobacter sp. JJSN TaxID=3453033 RepID=UPI003F771B4C